MRRIGRVKGKAVRRDVGRRIHRRVGRPGRGSDGRAEIAAARPGRGNGPVRTSVGAWVIEERAVTDHVGGVAVRPDPVRRWRMRLAGNRSRAGRPQQALNTEGIARIALGGRARAHGRRDGRGGIRPDHGRAGHGHARQLPAGFAGIERGSRRE